MKKHVLISSFVLAGLSLSAQTIPNAGFETWISNNESTHMYSVPQNWITMDVIQTIFSGDSTFVLNSVVPASTSHSGTSAVRLQTGISTASDTIGGVIYSVNSFADLMPLFNSSGMSGFPISARPANFTGYYRLNVTAGDYGISAMLLTHWNTSTQTRDTLYDNETMFFTINQSAWTPFSFPITYSSGATPDTCIIGFALQNGNSIGTTQISSYFELDDLGFSGLVPIGISEQETNLSSAFYPNPMNDRAIIHIEGAQVQNASLEIYDLRGKCIRTDAGLNGNQISFARNGLAGGTYLYRVVQDGVVMTQGKMTVTE
jgi:hypothetical protein